MSKELSLSQSAQYVGPYRLEKTLGKGQTGEYEMIYVELNTVDDAPFFFRPLMHVWFLFLPLYMSFRTGQARGPLYYGSEGSHQNSQQGEAVGVGPDEGTVWHRDDNDANFVHSQVYYAVHKLLLILYIYLLY